MEASVKFNKAELRTLLLGAYLAGFEASGEGYNGELMRDGMTDEKEIRKKAGSWAGRCVNKMNIKES